MLAQVKIWNQEAGVVRWDEKRNCGIFQFQKAFLKSGLDLSPIEMPLSKANSSDSIFLFPYLNHETFKGLPGLLADSLPDKFGNKMIDTWLANQGKSISSFNPVNRLCYIGARGMGALEFEPVVDNASSSSELIQIKKLVQFAKSILNDRQQLSTQLKKNTTKGLETILQIGSSAGGARAKAIIAYNEKTDEVRSGQIDNLPDFNYWLIKFDGVNDKQLSTPKGYGKIEYAYHLMAKEAGINMSDCKLLTENNRAHFMTKRFDRIGSEKQHMQTLCGLAHFDYNQPQAYSYEQALLVMRQLKLPHVQMQELFRRMVFNVMARNQDDHTKNISFLMDKNGDWKLSPAYDITFAFNPSNFWLKSHQMSINGKVENINKIDVLTIAKQNSIKNGNAIIEQVSVAINQWKKFAKEAQIELDQQKLIQKQFNKFK
jgi:serine/threonine-protein kinase HipA